MKIVCPVTHRLISAGIPRYRDQNGPAWLSAGFRPFFLLAALWSAVAVPLWLLMFLGHLTAPILLPPATWHAHEMVYGFGAAAVAGFLLTAIPNWTGRMPLQNAPLAALIGLWAAGRMAMLVSETVGAPIAALLDLAFPLVFLAVVAREIVAGANWRNLPMLAALGLLLTGNLLVHLEALDLATTAAFGNRLGIATLIMLISLVGGRIIPSFTGNWLTRHRPDVARPDAFSRFDGAALVLSAATLALWTLDPELPLAQGLALLAGGAVLLRLSRWRGVATLEEPLLWVLHLGYAWVGIGFLLLAASGWLAIPASSSVHALTAGAIGTMTLAVMTRASLGHTGRALTAGPRTAAIYALVSLAALMRVAAPAWPDLYQTMLYLSGIAWVAAFGLFVVCYGPALTKPPAPGAKPI